ncbi:MAG: RagB/SusD family nutrient uptake outer membrane protein [Flavisolibacter sp.]|nr:RagB/SusD family nutrient uptake outer membrane protein [Flavisolibacter sp.]MBD0284007.1 RagB/SusD family nutrient uptake outer membrane protein [Flavisolibacter sp.]
MKHNVLRNIIIASFLAGAIASCTKDLNRLPTNDITAETVYSTATGYRQAFAKVYGSYALTGNTGPTGSNDLQGVPDEGNHSDFLRTFFYLQELPTEEAIYTWGDPGLPDLHRMNWSSDNPILKGIYYRSFFQITLANDFIRQAADDKLSARGISGTDADEIRRFRAEARFLRAFQYWVLMDLFGNPAFVTEKDAIGSTLPRQIQRKDLFDYVESELKAIDADLATPRTNEYGRADKAAAWALLARMYLNAQVYTGTARYNDAITYSKKVIDAGYSLIPDYRQLMLADNNLNTNEFILTINYDGLNTQTYGGTTALVHGQIISSTSMKPTDFGVGSGWTLFRTTKNLPNLFPDYTGTADKRAQFFQQTLEINDISTPTEGFAVTKYKNVTRTGAPAPHQDPNKDFSDIDFPLFRLAEMYLIYAEAVLRGGTGGDNATALQYINLLRTRAYSNTSGNIQAGQLTLDFILDERGRELYWECFRRTDLIRYNRFVEGSYLWPWKGGVKNGRGVESFRTIYPIPSAELGANPNLKQNTGY